ncbi:hypothetical protein BDV95DRAFT_606033 [Massariosphaeria phaeospora]|uniref:SUZ domain-containing protein n=1 Tax=Massariosphaeria phaeospora TaxID=100035 RepID=A0A7C8I762_9PLEO|nr:hypothetical protein BDV95DRAFT_606033 [Massariosphaeria phaeospora]
MATTTSVPTESAQVKPSFAKVVASAYKPQHPKDIASAVKPSTTTPQSVGVTQKPKSSTLNNNDAPKVVEEKRDERIAKENAGDTATRTGQWANTAGPVVLQPASKEEEPAKSRSSGIGVKFITMEETTTQLSSSDGSAKPPSLDGKSVASGTTFALDEKESIRPDDSASLRAVEEEDVTSPPDSVAASSRVGSDSGMARAFRDQLHEIAVLGPQPQRGAPPGRFPISTPNGTHALYDPNQPANGVGRMISQPLVSGIVPPIAGPPNMPAIPDEKLIEALESPRDRLFVVKIEQDFIDFINNSRENELSLPNCNTFYRMLAHRLADYYGLGHVVDSTMTGVKITKTPICRMPAPLSQMVGSTKSASTPPVDLPTRKIMRRGDDTKSGTNTTANSENPSKTTSESGGSDSLNGNDAGCKDKSNLTREEREARYREARQRIFGNSENDDGESGEAAGQAEEKDVSRSSSTSGKKKIKKQRNYDDDDFEARSRFNAYYSPQYTGSGYGADSAVYYSGFPGQMSNPQYSNVNPNASPPPSYGNGYSVMMQQDTQPQYGWPNQQYQSTSGPMGYQNYGSPQNGYDLSTDFQRGMQSYQSAGMASQVTPKMANPPMASYQETYQSQSIPMNPGWPQLNHQPPYPIAQSHYPPNGPNNRPMSAPLQGPVPGAYPYGQLPPSPYNGTPNRNQHPLPGSFNRQQFNPQSQAFIPGSRNAPFQLQPNMSQISHQAINAYGSYQMAASPMANQLARVSPPVAQTQSFGSPRTTQSSNLLPANCNQMTSFQGPPIASSQMIGALSGPSHPSATSIPAQSSIAKYGTPSHLPPKPPQPVQPASKFGLAGHISSLPRLPTSMAPGFIANSPVVTGGATASVSNDHTN